MIAKKIIFIFAVVKAAGQYAINDKSVGVQLFQWPFKSIESECEYLASKGYGWVQVSPVAPHPADCEDGQIYPWYLAYQPLAYKVGNRLGSEQDFKDMVSTCRSFKIDVIVDVVLNHNAYVNLKRNTGIGVTKPWSTFAFEEDMGDLGFNATHYQDKKCNENVSFTSDQNQFDCRAGNLVDIATENQFVRESIAEFLNMLLSFGAVGFRTDLATYMPYADWVAIKALMNKNYKNQEAFFAQEAFHLILPKLP